ALSSAVIGAISVFTMYLRKKVHTPLERTLVSGLFSIIEWVLGTLLVGFNYSSLSYAAVHFSPIRAAASIGGALLVAFIVVFGNVALGEVLLFLEQLKSSKNTKDTVTQKKKFWWLPSFIPIILWVVMLLVFSLPNILFKNNSDAVKSSISIAVIQDQDRDIESVFGEVIDGAFHSIRLESRIQEAGMLNPDIIIYPFSPWSGVISDTMDNTSFNKEVIAVDFKTFGAWLKANVAPETTFVLWGTALREGQYVNEIEFWKNGELVGAYQKRKIFPFLDYTPMWAQSMGIYSTPFDATAGTSTRPVEINGVTIGSLVCSEVMDPLIAWENARNADIVFAVGSEAVFTNPLAGEFNLINAQLRATETRRPIIRANKLGPSAIIDSNGVIIEKMDYGESGILFGKIEMGKNKPETLYGRVGDYALLSLFTLYLVFILYRK
ncbi:MAG: nitrilase-related carbon-nitrogen hydrolase, partial [Patescibacteria group bacterium]